MSHPIVADTSVLMDFDMIGRLDLLKTIFSLIFVPMAVSREVFADKRNGTGTLELKMAFAENTWLKVQPVSEFSLLNDLARLGAGEAEALALAKELGLAVLMADSAGRRAAIRYKITMFGTLAVLKYAKLSGQIALAKPLIKDMVKAGRYYSPEVIKRFLMDIGEA